MSITKGKLINLVSKGELPFSINPQSHELSTSFDYQVESCLGQAGSVVSYQSAGPSSFKFELFFDSDADDKLKVGSVEEFLKKLTVIDEESRSVPRLEYRLGSFKFVGFCKNYRYAVLRFDNKGEPTSVRLSAELISDGSYEGGGSA